MEPKMQVTRPQFLLFILVLVLSVFAWFGALYLFMKMSMDAQWVLFCLFFGACIFSAIVGWQIENIAKLFKPRHATKKRYRSCAILNKFRKFKRGPVVVDPPVTANAAFTPQKLGSSYMQQKLEELKHLAVKGVDHE